MRHKNTEKRRKCSFLAIVLLSVKVVFIHEVITLQNARLNIFKNENPNILSLLTDPDLTIGLLKFKMAVKKVSALEFRRFIYSYYLSKLLDIEYKKRLFKIFIDPPLITKKQQPLAVICSLKIAENFY